MKYEDRHRAGSFGEDAEQYDRTRPTYPVALIDHLVDDSPGPVLDVGCGTGIASRLFTARGCDVVGVEADARMATVARGYGLSVEDGRFEEWDPAGRRFDLLISAQAWHWVDPTAGTRKAVEALRPGGRIGLFWNRGQPPLPLRAALDDVYQRAAPQLGRGYAVPTGGLAVPDEDCRRAGDTLRANKHLGEIAIRVFPHRREYTTATWLDQLPTHSDHRTLPEGQLTRLLKAVGEEIDRFGGRFEMQYDTWLVEARRAPSGG